MSAITEGRAGRTVPARGKTPADPMPRGIALSAALHLGILILVLLGLPNLFRTPPAEETPIAVDLVTIGPQTHATRVNRFRPMPKAKPEPSDAPPVPVPERKPEPRQANAEPPSSAATPAPPPERPEPPQRRESREPPPPPPPMKPAEAKPEPMPPPPEAKPRPPREPHRMAREMRRPEIRKTDTAAFDKLIDHLDKAKPRPASFDSLLKNLTRDAPPPTDDTPPRPQRVAAGASPSSQPKAPLGSQLTASEIDLLRQQIERCWVVPAGARDAQDLDIEIKAVVNPDGTVRAATIVDTGRYASDPFFRAAADSAKRAMLNPQCSPLRLPPDKYEAWHDLDLFFNPKDLL